MKRSGLLVVIYLLTTMVVCPDRCYTATRLLKTSYKNYTVHTFRGIDILCEPYQIKKGDWISKILRRKGDISNTNFPLFLAMFKSFNPHIPNPNDIVPGQQIILPLREFDSRQFQPSKKRQIIVPMLQLSEISHELTGFVEQKKVKEGDRIEALMDRFFLDHEGRLMAKGEFALKLANPDLKTFTPLVPNTFINIPLPAMCLQPWFPQKFQASHSTRRNRFALNPANRPLPAISLSKYEKTKQTPLVTENSPPVTSRVPAAMNRVPAMKRIQQYATMVDGQLINQGIYHFPDTETRKDMMLDLAFTPIIELENNSKIIIFPRERPDEELLKALKLFWKDITVMDMEMVDIKLAPPPPTISIPPDRRKAVTMLLEKSGQTVWSHDTYTVMVGGVEIIIDADRVERTPGPDLLILFDQIYGNALNLLQQQGYTILPISPSDGAMHTARELFGALDISTVLNPVFMNRSTRQSLSIPGLFIAGSSPLFLSTQDLNSATQDFFSRNGVAVIRTSAPSPL
ncbi:hypothetical protein [Desulfocicer niacini]